MKTTVKILPPALTEKQIAVLRALVRRNPDGSLLDVYQLLERVPGATRSAMLCSLRHLCSHDLIEEAGRANRGRSRMTYAATAKGYALVKSRL